MALYAIGDTHFSESAGKPMDIFGGAWKDYRRKLLKGFECLKEEDTLVICGDFSWGMSMNEALDDFRLISCFPGKKVFLKGNHDYWWETVSKMNRFFQDNDLKDLLFLHNNCIFYSGTAICGTRGWFFDPSDESAGDEKIFKRELIRLEASLSEAVKNGGPVEIICFLHYPPVFGTNEVEPITAILKNYGVSRCYYGHLHGDSLRGAFNGVRDGIAYQNISADNIGFRPIIIKP
ncbi:MAG: metallophosphoesterase [Clostridiaceae bacterium]|nr:metallophosphoesterase [Clostridiaceae bacterium]